MRAFAESVLLDLRFALRGFSRSPGPLLVAAATMALAIGSTTAVFSVVDRVMFRPLPYAQPDRLVWFGMKAPINRNEFLLEGDYWRFFHHAGVFQAITNLTNSGECDLTEREPLRLTCVDVAANFLPVMGLQPALGRNFTEAETVPNGPRAALLSYGFWQRRYGGDRGIVGRILTLDGRATRIAGVLPAHFELPTLFRADIVRGEQVNLQPTGSGAFLTTFGRLLPGVTVPQAGAALAPVYRECLKFVPAGFARDVSFHVTPLRDRQVEDYRAVSLLLLAAISGVLLIACSNIAGLLLARAAGRRRELAVRAAIGAARGRLIRQMLTESLLLAGVGGVAGIALAAGLMHLLIALSPPGIPRIDQSALDARVLLFSLAASAGCGLVFGLAPALRTPRSESLNYARIAGGGLRLRQWLVTFQIALTFVLLVSAVLLVESLWRLQRVGLGFRAEQLITVRVQLGRERYPAAPQQAAFFNSAAQGLARLPGVGALALSDTVPLYGYAMTMIFSNIEIEGRPPLDPHRATGGMTVFRTVSPGYFETLGIPILHGRGFTAADQTSSDPVAIIDENLAHRLFPGDGAVGHRMRSGLSGSFRTIVGIARAVKNAGLAGGDDPEYYYVWRQDPASGRPRGHILLRSAGDPAALAVMIRSEIARLDPTLPLTITTMQQNLSRYTGRPRFESFLFGLFAALAVVLAAVGMFGVMSSLVSDRTAELGVRIALGATGLDVLALVLRHALVLASIGLASGAAAAWFGARPLESLLFGVQAHDLASYAVVLSVLLLVALAAAFRPALRALKLDPAAILRHE
jgi:predicted permease